MVLDGMRRMLPERKTGMIALTALGRQKADSDHSGMGADWKVLWDLKAEGPSSITEIGTRTGYDPTKIRAICKELAQKGLVEVR